MKVHVFIVTAQMHSHFSTCLDIYIYVFVWFLRYSIFDEGAYLTVKSVFHKYLNQV